MTKDEGEEVSEEPRKLDYYVPEKRESILDILLMFVVLALIAAIIVAIRLLAGAK